MYPHERSLVKKLGDKPFALVGVNSDDDLEALKKVLETEQITWRSFRNNQEGGQVVSKDWNIQGWPTVFLIDHKGVIRQKYIGAPEEEKLDTAIEKLLEAAEKDAKPAK